MVFGPNRYIVLPLTLILSACHSPEGVRDSKFVTTAGIELLHSAVSLLTVL